MAGSASKEQLRMAGDNPFLGDAQLSLRLLALSTLLTLGRTSSSRSSYEPCPSGTLSLPWTTNSWLSPILHTRWVQGGYLKRPGTAGHHLSLRSSRDGTHLATSPQPPSAATSLSEICPSHGLWGHSPQLLLPLSQSQCLLHSEGLTHPAADTLRRAWPCPPPAPVVPLQVSPSL